ncbi:RICIN domain-containing protein [Streptomyces canus]|uniref:RICIN domain-containing protein n=1 Tax=Streptomyces canus TaxID=58343 RepID=UPI0027D909B1|nr:RICIN domain-containing protein [Streptomyces canus]
MAGATATTSEPGEADAESVTAADEEEAEEAPEGTAEAASAAPSGRPHKSLLAGAAIVGTLLMTVPFLVGGDGEDVHAGPVGATPGTVLGSPGDGSVYGAIGSASPTDGGSPRTTHPVGHSAASHGAGGPGAHSSASGTMSPPPADTVGFRDDVAPRPTPGRALSAVTGATSSGSSSAAAGVSIWSYASGRCIDVRDAGGDGTPLQIWDCNGFAQQSWRFMSDGTVRALGLCMDVAWGSTSDGAVVQLATCSHNPAQQFRLNSAHDLVNPQANKCVDVKDRKTGNGTRLQLWDCNGQDIQKWSTG